MKELVLLLIMVLNSPNLYADQKKNPWTNLPDLIGGVSSDPTEDDQIPISTDKGTSTWISIPTCSSTTMLNYNTNTNSFSCVPIAVTTPPTISSATPSTFQAGSVIFSTGVALAEDNSNLYFNNTTNNLGVGAIPLSSLHVEEVTSETADTVDILRLRMKSSGTPGVGFGNKILFDAQDDNVVSRNQAKIDTTWVTVDGSNSTSSLGIFVRSNGELVERARWLPTELVFNDLGNDYDFRVEGDTIANLIFIDASVDTVSLNGIIQAEASTSFEMPNGASPTVDAFGEIAGDNDLWAASRGAPIFYDGTASTALVNILVSDIPSNGQVPTWNTGGTITWETPVTTKVILAGSSTTGSAATHYMSPGEAFNNTEDTADVWRSPAALTCTTLYVNVNTTPGGSATWVVSLNINGTASTDLTCTIANPDTTCNDSGSVAVVAGDTINVEWLETGSASNTAGDGFSVLCT